MTARKAGARAGRSPPAQKQRASPRSHKVAVLIQDERWLKTIPRLVTLTRRFARAALEAAGRAKAEATVVLGADSQVRELNLRFRNQNKPTNVLSFPNGRSADLAEIGEIILALETVRREAVTQGKPFVNHLAHLVVHGILHLLGYDHERPGEARAMERLEADILSMLGMPNPYGRGRPRRG